MKFRKGDNTYKELLERSVAHCRQSDKMASGEHTAAFNDEQIEELCETFNTVSTLFCAALTVNHHSL